MDTNPIKKITNIKVELTENHAALIDKPLDSLAMSFKSTQWTVNDLPTIEKLIEEIGESYSFDSDWFNAKNYGMFFDPVNKKRGIYEIIIKERFRK
jgi:hypothetical protein